MTDITELAQSLKAAAEKSGVEHWVNNRGEVNTADYEVDGGTYIDHICDCEIVGTESPRAEFIAMANPANVLALVEALESEKRICATWRKTAEANSEKLEKAQQQMTESENRVRKQNRHICELFDDNTALRQRIAELESRLESADKLQDSAFRSGLQHGFSLGQTDDQKGYEQSMAAYSPDAAIKWESA